MVKWIVELHGGCVEVESEPGRGALFRVILPGTPPPAMGAEGL
jgi:signal transduction histidine kinase